MIEINIQAMSQSNQSMGITFFNNRGFTKYLLVILLLFFTELSVSGIIAAFTTEPRYEKPEVVMSKRIVNPENYLPIDTLISVGITVLSSNIDKDVDLSVDHIEIYQKKGVVMLLFKNNPWVVQLEGATGRVLDVSKQKMAPSYAIHSARWFDKLLGTKGVISTIYTTIMGLIVISFSLFGIWALLFSQSKKNKK